MYGQWKVLDDETFREYGYRQADLSKYSHSPLVVECSLCNQRGYKRPSEANRKHICASIIDGKKYCFKCKQYLLVEEFSKNRHTHSGYQKVCKSCFSSYECVKRGYEKRGRKLKESIELSLRHRETSIKRVAKMKNVEYSIPTGYLFQLYLKQNKLCWYSKLPISISSGTLSPTSISVDRVDPTRGYTPDNIVLCSYVINSFKNSMSAEQFKTYLVQALPALTEYAYA